MAVWGGCVRTRGANRAVLGRFGAILGGSGCQQSGRLCAHTGSGSGCSGLFWAVRAVRAVCAHGQGASPLYGLSSALQALLRFGSFFLRSVRPVGTPASAAFYLGCGGCAPCRHSGFGCILFGLRPVGTPASAVRPVGPPAYPPTQPPARAAETYAAARPQPK